MARLADQAVVVDIPLPQRVQTLLLQSPLKALGVVLTHAHSDHVPTLDQLVDFIANAPHAAAIEFVMVPPGYIQAALRHSDSAKRARNMHAVDRLIRTHGQLVRDGSRGDSKQLGAMRVDILAPSYVERERQIALRPGTINESSLVVRVAYGEASVVLPGDIDARGIRSLLDHEPSLRATVLKVPHHGAWPGPELDELLERLASPVVLLSVGSSNQHAHVRPEVFKSLLALKARGAVVTFACTEVTGACVYTSVERASGMRLLGGVPCAGDIEVVLEADGSYKIPNAPAHRRRIATVQRPACEGKADL